MPVSCDALGARMPSRSVTVETRQLLAYAAGIDQVFPACFDDAGDIVGAPQFCVSLEWPLVNNVRDDGLLKLRPEETVRGVHVIQDSHFHAPIRPGDDVETSGQIVEIRRAKAGAFVCYRLVTTRIADGAPLVTSYNAGIFRDVGVTAESAALDRPPPRPPLDAPFSETDTHTAIYIGKTLPHVYSECADIWNPIHTERRAARAAGLKDIILHGTATWALAGRELMRLYTDEQPARLKRLYGRFTGQVFTDTHISLRHRQSDNVIHFDVIDAAGKVAIRDGLAVVA